MTIEQRIVMMSRRIVKEARQRKLRYVSLFVGGVQKPLYRFW